MFSEWTTLASEGLEPWHDMLEARERLGRAFCFLKPREADIIRLRYGFVGGEHTLEDVGDMMGVSKQRVREILARAMRVLRYHLDSDKKTPSERLARERRKFDVSAYPKSETLVIRLHRKREDMEIDCAKERMRAENVRQYQKKRRALTKRRLRREQRKRDAEHVEYRRSHRDELLDWAWGLALRRVDDRREDE